MQWVCFAYARLAYVVAYWRQRYRVGTTVPVINERPLPLTIFFLVSTIAFPFFFSPVIHGKSHTLWTHARSARRGTMRWWTSFFFHLTGGQREGRKDATLLAPNKQGRGPPRTSLTHGQTNKPLTRAHTSRFHDDGKIAPCGIRERETIY